MAIWHELYDIFARERQHRLSANAEREALVFEINQNLATLADALSAHAPSGVTSGLSLAPLLHAAFDQFRQSGRSLNTLQSKKLSRKIYANYAEFERYDGQDTRSLINNAYLRVHRLNSLLKQSTSNDLSRRAQSLFRFLMLLNAHIQQQPLKQKGR
ncbi:hypothetical protein [Bowmanella sp. JS7-9]|uniref:Uncharacterized protein n=1 Tax=Pseudobowmanella zhangzhouensis TaxID=1537679 RepID=A0ABW1XHC5_9ALTE|nr:hypothetical protein [Bowmanella sp. JS7-9]TBX20795.1 hypothetical protein TK45_13485 [Bowmanella sp. JS7-9]